VRVELDGILSADFDALGRCTAFREWWHRRERAPASNQTENATSSSDPAQTRRYVESAVQLVTELSVRDVRRSLSFYEALGFQAQRVETTFAAAAWEDHQFFLSQDGLLLEPLAAPIVNVRVMLPDVDRVWQRVVEMQLPVAAPIGDRSYGLRDFTVTDPDGYGLRFATWLPTFAPQRRRHAET
jgi:catechol 2,3-dioxygenase-like lactoylglutathione lyase family enzyme